ncbi:MAG: sulfurtransferase [Vicinamibacterales bacterium]|nr:sulfurtransferase [Vicinamibacterales bacterium]
MSHPLLATPTELSLELKGDRSPLVLDLRPAEAFADAHLPGAVHLDLFGLSIIDTDPAPLNAFFWMIEHLLASRGVSDDVPVVVYDDASGMRAARAFWFLEFFGHPNVRLLDGGYGAWARAGLATTRETTKPKGTEWTGTRNDDRLASWRDVKDRIGTKDAIILDTRSDGEYCGTTVRAARGGAVPGAIHLEWTNNLGPDGTFKTGGELTRMYADAGVTPDREVVTYCQGGYRAAHSYLALRLIGYPRIRNYVGSWKEWGDRVDLPIEHPKK